MTTTLTARDELAALRAAIDANRHDRAEVQWRIDADTRLRDMLDSRHSRMQSQVRELEVAAGREEGA